MNEPIANSGQRYTWADYQSWNDDKRWEIIGGEAFMMGSPSSRHQRIVIEMCRQMANYYKGKSCQLFVSPMDVKLSEEDTVQPDLLIVCNPAQITRTHIEGPPTLAVEITSPSSTTRDRLLKLNLYARHGVKEYWIVTPWPSLVEVLLLEGGRYVVHHVFDKNDTLISPTFPGLQVRLADVFDFPLEPGEEPPVVHEPPAPLYRAAVK